MEMKRLDGNKNENVFYLLRKRQWASWPFAILYSTTTVVILSNLDFLDAFVILGAVHILVFLLTLWFVDFKCFLQYSGVRDIHHATACKITMSGYRQLVPLYSRKLAGSLTDEFYFDLHNQRFIYSDGTFVMLPYPSDETFGYYLKSNGHETEAKLQLAAEKWGHNVFDHPSQTFQMLMKEHCMEPYFLFQVLCGLLCLDGYVYSSLFILFALFALESMFVHTRIKTLSDLSRIRVDSHMLMAFRCGKWTSVSGTDLFPGDVVSVRRDGEETSVPADMLILAGSAIVSETILTGKFPPQRKVSIMGREPEEHLSFKRDKQHVLFCGTKILQHTPDMTFHMKTPDNGCLAIVLRTGFETIQGRLMQTIFVSRDTVSANSWERGLFSLLFVVYAIIAASYQFKEGLEDPNWSRHKLLSKSSLIVTSLIPPGLPKELWMAIITSFVELRRRDIFFGGPFGIPFSGKKHTGDRSSMASPSLTAKYPSVSITRYLVRERHTTLVTTLQMLKILGLHCFAFTYVQCIMHLNGVQLGNVLTLISHFFTTNFILSISDTRPLSSAGRRHHPHVLLSILGQSALHMLLLISSVKEAKKHMPNMHIKPESEFESNLVITVSFIASMMIQVTTFAVNYLGHPLNKSVSENKQFRCVLLSAVVFLAVITSAVSRNFNDLLMLVPLPRELRDKLLMWGALMFFGCYTWEWFLNKRSLPSKLNRYLC